MKKFKDMDKSEFYALKTRANIIGLSRYAKFMKDTAGYQFKRSDGVELDKWEVFHLTSRSGIEAINGNVPGIYAEKKYDLI